MERERTEAGTYAETVTLEDVRDVFDAVRGPVVTSSDVAEALECTTEAARQKLTRLYDRGEVDKRKTGRTVVYWRIDEDVLAAGDLQGDPTTTLDESDERRRESDPTPEPTEPPGEADRRDDAGEAFPEDADPDVTVPDAEEIDEVVRSVVASVAQSWDDDERLATRKRAAAAVLQYAVDTGEAVGKSGPVVDAVRDVHPVEGQNRETYWRQNLRPVLRSVGEYSRATKGYAVEEVDPDT